MIRIEKKSLLETLRLLRKYERMRDGDIYAQYLHSTKGMFDRVKYRYGLQDLLKGYIAFRPNASNESFYALLESVGIAVVDSGDAQ